MRTLFAVVISLLSAIVCSSVGVAQTISLSDQPTSAGFGQSVTLTATVLNGSIAEIGRVLIYDGTTGNAAPFLYASLDSTGTASLSVSSLSVGTHSLVACWDNTGSSNLPDTCPTTVLSPALTLEIHESTTTTLATSNNPILNGTDITLTARVSADDGAPLVPTGTVTFANGENTLCNNVVLQSGSAQCPIYAAQLVAGANALTASYSGNASLSVLGSSQALTEYVQSSSSLAVSSVPNPSTYGQQVTFVLNINSAASTLPTGNIFIYDNNTLLASSTLSGSSNPGSYLTTSLSVGSHPITAVYQGDDYHAPSSASTVLTQIVSAPTSQDLSDFSLALTSSSMSVKVGGTASTALTAASLYGFSGSVTLSCPSLPSGISCSFAANPFTLTSGGQQSTTLTLKTGSSSSAWLLFAPLLLIVCGAGKLTKNRFASIGFFAMILPLLLQLGCGGTGSAGYSGLIGTHNISVTASSGSLSHTQTLNLTVTQ